MSGSYLKAVSVASILDPFGLFSLLTPKPKVIIREKNTINLRGNILSHLALSIKYETPYTNPSNSIIPKKPEPGKISPADGNGLLQAIKPKGGSMEAAKAKGKYRYRLLIDLLQKMIQGRETKIATLIQRIKAILISE